MAVFPGFKKWMHIALETAWGTLDGTPAYLHLPYLSQNIVATPIVVMAEHFVGQRQKLHQEATGYDVAGNITTSLFAWQDAANDSLAQHLIEWAFGVPDGWDLNSKSVELAENDVDNKRWLGCRVNSATLSGSPGQPLSLSLDIIGVSETGGVTEQAITKATQVAILQSQMFFHTMTFEVPSATAFKIDSFSLTINNQLQPRRMNSTVIDHLTAGERMVSLAFQIPKSANTYDAFKRTIGETTTTAQLNFEGLHKSTGATGTKTTIVADIDRMNFNDATVIDGDKNVLVAVGPQYQVLSPASTDPDISWTFGES